jgi:hypothetical protein
VGLAQHQLVRPGPPSGASFLELYREWHRLRDLAVPTRGKPWQFKSLTVRHVYNPLVQSSGKLYALLKALKAKDGDRAKKLFQFLKEIGARALRIQLGRLLEMAESSQDKYVYEDKIAERFGGQKELELYVPPPSAVRASQPTRPPTAAASPFQK